jgi:hypothetical protein
MRHKEILSVTKFTILLQRRWLLADLSALDHVSKNLPVTKSYQFLNINSHYLLLRSISFFLTPQIFKPAQLLRKASPQTIKIRAKLRIKTTIFKESFRSETLAYFQNF